MLAHISYLLQKVRTDISSLMFFLFFFFVKNILNGMDILSREETLSHLTSLLKRGLL